MNLPLQVMVCIGSKRRKLPRAYPRFDFARCLARSQGTFRSRVSTSELRVLLCTALGEGYRIFLGIDHKLPLGRLYEVRVELVG
jgi:hypothetical protein